MYKIYSTVIRIVNTLYTVLFVSLIIGLFLVSAGAYIKSKIKQTNLDKYGECFPWNTEEAINKRKNTALLILVKF